MLEAIFATITHFVVNTISALGYGGVAVLMAVESAAIPLPSEIIMPFAGFLVSEGRFTLFGVSLAGALGSVLGSWATYWLGRYGGRPFVERFGKYILISHHDLDLADRFFAKYGAWATFIGRVLPGVRTYISIPAGIARARFWPFTAAAFFGSFIWSLLLAYIGLKLGQNWEALKPIFHKFDVVIVLAVLIGAVWWIRRHLRKS